MIRKCNKCSAKLPRFRLKRSLLEKLVLHRNKRKYACEVCGEINFTI